MQATASQFVRDMTKFCVFGESCRYDFFFSLCACSLRIGLLAFSQCVLIFCVRLRVSVCIKENTYSQHKKPNFWFISNILRMYCTDTAKRRESSSRWRWWWRCWVVFASQTRSISVGGWAAALFAAAVNLRRILVGWLHILDENTRIES